MNCDICNKKIKGEVITHHTTPRHLANYHKDKIQRNIKICKSCGFTEAKLHASFGIYTLLNMPRDRQIRLMKEFSEEAKLKEGKK